MLNTQLLTFLEGKRASEKYDYQDKKCCAAAQFNQSIGREYRVNRALLDNTIFDGRLESIAARLPHTFGAMRFRARKEFTEA
jgi:hypothetical protein